MGKKLPANEPGNDCDFCWGLDKPLGLLPTPRIIQFKLSGLAPGEFWIEGADHLLTTPQLLIQDIQPCAWQLFVDPYIFFVRYFVNQTQMFVRNFVTAKSVFEHVTFPSCATSGGDPNGEFLGRQAFAGSALITWSLEGLA